MTSVYPIWAEYETAKSTTGELVLISQNGILSLKIVVTANGKKTAVYTGFEPATWSWTGANGGGTTDASAWCHKYIVAQEKAAAKNGGKIPERLPFGSVRDTLHRIPSTAMHAIDAAIKSDPKVKSHFDSLTAEHVNQPPSTVTVSTKPKVDRHAELLTADADYGRF